MPSHAQSAYGWRARLGLVVPPTNSANEAEWSLALSKLAPRGAISLHVTRMPLHLNPATQAAEQALLADLEVAVGLLAPVEPDVVAYGCTAGSQISPRQTLAHRIEAMRGIPAVATAPSLVDACLALGVSRIALATPYDDAMNRHEADFLAREGVTTVAMAGLGAGDAEGFRAIRGVSEAQTYRLARAVDSDGCQALVISCTDLATFGIISTLEQDLGKPVITSNQATLWAALRRIGIGDPLPELGRLFSLPEGA